MLRIVTRLACVVFVSAALCGCVSHGPTVALLTWTPPDKDSDGNPITKEISYVVYDITGQGSTNAVFEGVPSNKDNPFVIVPAERGKLNRWVMKVMVEGMLPSWSNVAEADIDKDGNLK